MTRRCDGRTNFVRAMLAFTQRPIWPAVKLVLLAPSGLVAFGSSTITWVPRLVPANNGALGDASSP
jgi:hypothetical protein